MSEKEQGTNFEQLRTLEIKLGNSFLHFFIACIVLNQLEDDGAEEQVADQYAEQKRRFSADSPDAVGKRGIAEQRRQSHGGSEGPRSLAAEAGVFSAALHSVSAVRR